MESDKPEITRDLISSEFNGKHVSFDLFIAGMECMLASKLKKNKWRHCADMYFEYVDGSWISFVPDILNYFVDGQCCKAIWLRRYESDLTKEAFESIFSCCKPFRDDDYSGGNFWINPLIPEGYSENHVL